VIGDVGYESAIMANQQHGFIGAAQIFLEPASRIEVEVVRRLVQQQDIRRTYQLPGKSKPASLSPTQLLEWLSARALGIEAKTVQDGIYAWSKGVSTLAIESLEILIVFREHLRRCSFACFPQQFGLVRERLLEGEQLGQLSGSRFPDSRCIPKIAMLLQKSEPKPRLTSDRAFGRCLRARDQPEERRLPAAVATYDSPTLAACNREGYVVKYSRRAEGNRRIRNGDLGQERSTLEQAARHRSRVWTV
jgi:hypothetical protein